jgi:multiple sugar transport system permease protein
MVSPTTKKKVFSAFIWIIVVVLLLWFLFPIYWMVATSIKSNVFDLSLVPTELSPSSYIQVIMQTHDKTGEYWIQLFNSFVIAGGTIVITLIVSTLGAYTLARLRFRLHRILSYTTLFTYIIPTAFLAIPFFILMLNYGLVDNLFAVIIATSTFATPYCIWVLAEYMSNIPVEIEESAMIDGASRLRIFTSIMLPLITPALVAIATYAFIYGWNEYLYVFILITHTNKWNIPLAIGSMLTSDDVPWDVMTAMATIYSIPPVAFYYIFKKYMVAGLVKGAVKR